jgi:tetratricopeptide (TPR) repeat protein
VLLRDTILYLVLAAAALSSGTEKLGEQQATPPPPASQSPSLIALSLAVEPRPGFFYTVPAGKPFELVLAGRLPGSTYRLTAQYKDRPPVVTNVPANRSERAWSVFLPQNSGSIPAVCSAYVDKARAILAVSDERELAPLVNKLLAQPPGESECAVIVQPLKALIGEVQPRVTLTAPSRGDASQVLLERLDPEGKTARRWEFQVLTPHLPALAFSVPTEEAWLVLETVRDVAALIVFAREGLLRDPKIALSAVADRPGTYALDIEVNREGRRFHETLSIKQHVWSPDTYESLASRLLAQLEVRPRVLGQLPGSTLATLTDLRTATIEAENQRVSRWLRENPGSPVPHERAALVLGAFGLREAAGVFSDQRRTLCSMSAHLAVARALRHGGPPSAEGEYAGILLESMAGRARPALALLAKRDTKSASPTEAAWNNAIFMRSSLDWRRLAEPNRASLLERLEYLRALVACFDDSRALAFLDKARPEPIVDWGRILLQSTFGVESSRRFALEALVAESLEVSQLWPAEVPTPIPASAATAVAKATRPPEPRLGIARQPVVITRQTWARFLERHIAFAAAANYEALKKNLGLSEDAAEFLRRAKADLETLDLGSIVDLQWTLTDVQSSLKDDVGQPGGHDVSAPCEKLVPLVRARPDIFNASTWGLLSLMGSRTRFVRQFPEPEQWFVPVLPRGTAYDGSARTRHAQLGNRVSVSELQAAVPLEVADPVVLGAMISKTEKRSITATDYAAHFSEVAEYSADILRRWVSIARQGGSDDLTPLYQKLCSLEARDCVDLGSHLASLGRDDEAAAAYERAVESSRDRVHLSNNLAWLVDYYLARRRQSRALELAKMAADVYSDSGLGNMGRVLERLGRIAEAETYYEQVEKRYDNPWWRQCSSIRQVRRAPDRTRDNAGSVVREMFPQGLVKVTVDAMKEPPKEGAIPAFVGPQGGVADELKKVGVGDRDFIVALDGYRVTNWAQYRCVETFSDAPEATIIVYRHPAYKEFKGPIRRRKSWGPIPPDSAPR